jgi:iron(III) transport system permease protein
MIPLSNKQKSFGNLGLDALPSLILMLVLIVYPLACLLLQSFLPHLFDAKMSLKPSLSAFVEVMTDRFNLIAIFNSFTTGLCAAAVATLFGSITAFAAWKATGRTKKWIDSSVWLVLFTPSYLIGQGWIIFMQHGGIVSQLFGLAPGSTDWFFSRYGLIVVMGFRYFPFVHLAMSQAFVQLGEEYIRAGRLLGAKNSVILRQIVFPLLTPAWLAGASISFAEGFGDFGLAAAITPHAHIPMLTYQIYTALNQAPVNYSAASILALLVMLVTAGALWLQFMWMKKRKYTLVSTHSKPLVSKTSARWALWVSIFILGFALLLPLGSTLAASMLRTWSRGIAFSNLTFEHYRIIPNFADEGFASMVRSFFYALIAAGSTMIAGLLISYRMTFFQTKLNKMMHHILLSTMAIPGVVLAAGFVFAWNATWLVPIHLVLYGSSICLGLAYIALSLPYSTRLQIGAMSQLSANLVTAAQVLGARNTTVLHVVVYPLVRVMAYSSFFLTFIHTFFELPASVMLFPAGKPPLPIVISTRFNAFDWPGGAALAMEGMLFLLLIYLIGHGLFRLNKIIRRQR